MYKIERFGTTTLPHVNPVQDQTPGEGKLNLLELPGGGVFDAQGSDDAPVAQRALVKQCRLHSYTEATLLEAFRALRALVGKRHALYRRAYATDEVEWAWARLRQIRPSPRRYGETARYLLDMELDFALVSAVWNGLRHGDGWLLDDGKYLDTGLALDEGGNSVTLSSVTTDPATINNGGNAPVTEARFVIQCNGSGATAYRVQRYTDAGIQEEIQVATYVGPGCTLTIDCGGKTVEVDCPDWSASAAYDVGECVEGSDASGVRRYYKCTTAGTTGSSEPTWPESGTVTDGTVVWTHQDTVDVYAGFSYVHHYTDEWITLEPGDNTLLIARTGGSSADTFKWYFYDGWR